MTEDKDDEKLSLTLRLRPGQRKRFEAMAAVYGMDLSSYVRFCADSVTRELEAKAKTSSV